MPINMGNKLCRGLPGVLVVASLLSAPAAAAAATRFTEALKVPTRGAAGWTHFQIDGDDFLAVANFFSSAPGVQPSMTTESVVYRADVTDGRLKLHAVQGFATTGAHGVVSVRSPHSDATLLVVPNYYGGDTVVLCWTGKKFEETQRLTVDGGGNVIEFKVGDTQMIAIAEFNKGNVLIYALRSTPGGAGQGQGHHKGEWFELWQTVTAPGCGASATTTIDGELYLIAASYVTHATGWQTSSTVFGLNEDGTGFESAKPRIRGQHELATVGAHGVATLSVAVEGGRTRHYLFFSNDKDEHTTKQDSELFEWRVTPATHEGRYVSVQKVATDGAHAAELFIGVDGRSYLAVANLGDRAGSGSYRRDSVLYELDPTAPPGTPPLTELQRLPTLGATDFKAFDIKGTTFLAVSNEQDDVGGGDIDSTIWSLNAATNEKNARKQEEL